MSRLFLLVVVCLSTFASASSVEVVYVAQGTSVLTYDIDPQTLTFTQVGSLAISGAATFGGLVPSPNDHFVYVMAADSAQTMHLYVYATDANGALQSPPTQTLDSKNLQSAQVDPSASFLYAIYGTPTSTGNQTTYSIHRYVVNPSTGAVSQSTVEGKYTLNTFAGYTCNVTITGFNAAATELYDVVYCETHEGPYANYYERTVDATTGALGPDVQIYSWGSDGNGSGEFVQFAGGHIFDFVYPDNPPDSVNIYPVEPNTSKPVVQCTSSMLAACGALDGVVVHPSGKYILLGNSNNSEMEIEKVEYGEKKIVDTGNQVSNVTGVFGPPFSPDGTLAYGVNYTGTAYYLQVNKFNVSTSEVTPGGEIFVPSTGSGNTENAYFAARRF
jgi:hypothetical protein